MLTPDTAFSTGGLLAVIGWVGLASSLFVAPVRRPARLYAQIVVPVLLGLAYVVLIAAGWGATPGGGFGSIQEVRALFQNDAALAAGWLHYLAFDLFVGAYIVERGLDRRVPRLLLIPCLVLTFLFGPAGLLLFLILSALLGRGKGEATA